MLYATEYRKADGIYGDIVEATSWEEAQRVADARGRGERVIGSNVTEISVASMQEADAVVDAMNERDRSILQ